jgi:hypothetical protein
MFWAKLGTHTFQDQAAGNYIVGYGMVQILPLEVSKGLPWLLAALVPDATAAGGGEAEAIRKCTEPAMTTALSR